MIVAASVGLTAISWLYLIDLAGRSDGMGAAMRYGQRDLLIAEKTDWLNGEFANVVAVAFGDPIPLIPIADHGLAHGDDCHGMCATATTRLRDILLGPVGSPLEVYGGDRFLEASPGFFLNLCMAARKVVLSAAVRMSGSDLVTAIAGLLYPISPR